MRVMPDQNARLPFHFCFRAKKRKVREGPRRRVMPMRKRMLPIARSARSKRRIMPRRRNATPVQIARVSKPQQ